MNRRITRRLARLLVPATAALALVALVAGCHSGTPAAPDGTEIHVSCEFLSRDVPTGNFDAVIRAVVVDEESDVPQVGVGVYFRVRGGPGTISDDPVRTDNDGRAAAVLLARGATPGNEVTVEVSSGPATAEIELDVSGCFASSAVRPVADASVSPNPARANQDVTLDFSDSSDSDCPGGKPETWRIDWGDGDTDDGEFADDDEFTHQYAAADIPASNEIDIELEVEDCQGLTDTETVTLRFTP